MTTFVKKKLKDKEGNYLVTPSSADIVYCSDGETVATKLRKIENDEFSPTITQVNSMAKVGVGTEVDVSANVQEGYVKSAILKGNTLVNLTDTTKTVSCVIDATNLPYTVHYANTRGCSFTLNEIINPSWGYFRCYFNLGMVKPNTKYIVKGIFKNINNVVLSTGDGKVQWSDSSPVNDNSYAIITTYNEFQSNNDVVLYFNFTKTSNTTYSVDDIIFCEYVEGMENWDIPYFEGMQSVRMPVLTTTGKNLYSYGDLTINNPITNIWYYTNGKTSSFGSSCKRTDGGNWFYLEKGVYSYKSINENIQTNIILVGEGETLYDSGKEVPSGWYVFRFKTKPESVDYAKISQIQLEKGPNITTYEPYKSNILSTPQDLELRGIGDVQDTLDVTTGKVIQRIDEIVLDGSENWVKSLTVSGRYYVANLISSPVNTTSHICLSDKYASITTVESDKGSEGVALSNGNIIMINTTFDTLDAFKTNLENNNVTLQYVLATEVNKTVDLVPSGTHPTTTPYVWKDGHIQLSSASEENSLIPTLEYSLATSRGGQIIDNTKHIAKHDKRIYDLEMLMINSSVEDAYQRLLLQNDVQVMSCLSDDTRLNPMRYYMLSRLIEEHMYEETDMLNKLDLFFLYSEISFEQYLELSELVLDIEDIVDGNFEEVEENIVEEEGVVHE